MMVQDIQQDSKAGLVGVSFPQAAVPPGIPEAEVAAKPKRHYHSNQYKLKILRAVENCKEFGQTAALLRREGLYSSHLMTWRRQWQRGELQTLTPRKRGPQAPKPNPLSKRKQELERENRRLQRKLKRAELIIEVQKKISEALQIPGSPLDDERNG